MSRPHLRSTWAAFATALLLATLGNLRLWAALTSGPAAVSWLAIAATFLALFAILDLLLQAVAIPWLFKPVAMALLVLSAITSYFMVEYGVLIDSTMVRNTLQTNAAEAGELVTLRAATHVALLGVLPALLLGLARLRYGPARGELALRARVVAISFALAVLAALPAYMELSIVVRANRALRFLANPLAPIASLVRYAQEEQAAESSVLQPIAPDARRAAGAPEDRPRRRIVVLVVGETATASHFGLNGYGRDTTPELAARGVLNFPHVLSCGTSTAESVPCMFSALGRRDFSRAEAAGHENLLDVLQQVGIAVLWRDNNSGCKGVCDRVPFETVNGPESLRQGDEYLDEALLDGLQAHVDGTPGDFFIVLHQRGSHGPAYFKRSPPAFKRYLPECARNDLQNCTREELVNAYDNTILYTDHVLGLIIDFLAVNSRDAQVAMLYVSDHGESLGENGIYLHGLPYWLAPDEQKHVPMVFWASPEFWTTLGLEQRDLGALAARDCSHDNLFHTILGLFEIETAAYQPGLDVFLKPPPP